MDARAISAIRGGTNPRGGRLADNLPEIRSFESDPAWATGELREKFSSFVAGTFFKTLLDAMRKTVGKEKLIHGGRAEEIFQAQLDATLSQRMAESHGAALADELYQQFALQQGAKQTALTHGDASENAARRPAPDDVGRSLDDSL